MLTILIRAITIYIILIFMMRLLGKRQIGELEATELVTALLLSEIATMPITDSSMPVAFAIVPMIAIMALEVIMSFILIKVPALRRLVSSHPSVVIDKGRLVQRELKKQRISIEELICEIRSAGYSSIDEVYYAIIEENGTLTVIPKSAYRQPTASELGLTLPENGLMHIIISDGKIDRHGLSTINHDCAWLEKQLKKKKVSKKDVFLMVSDDSENITIIKKVGTQNKSK